MAFIRLINDHGDIVEVSTKGTQRTEYGKKGYRPYVEPKPAPKPKAKAK